MSNIATKVKRSTATAEELPIVNSDDNESHKGKRQNDVSRSTKQFLSIHKTTLILCFCFLFVISQFTSRRSSSTNKPVIKGQARIVIQDQVQKELAKLVGDVQDTADEESIVTTSWLHNAVLEAQTSIHRTLDNILRNNDISESELQNFDEKVSNEVEKELQSELKLLVNNVVTKVQSNLNELQQNINADPNEVNIQALRSAFLNEMKSEIDDLEKQVEGKIHTVTKKVESKLLKEINIDEDEEDLELEEIDSVIEEEEEDIMQAANQQVSTLQDEIQHAEKNLESNIKKSLREFLTKKKMSKSDVLSIEHEVISLLEDRMQNVIQDEFTTLEEVVNEELDDIEDALGGEVAEESEEGTTVADIVEKKYDVLKSGLTQSFKDLTAGAKGDLLDSLRDITKDVEKKVFENKGVDVSEDEFTSLVEKETRDLEKSAVVK